MFEHPIEVRFRDCDALRHVNHAVYFSYCEQARFAFWRQLTGSNSLDDIKFLVVRVECDYRRPATLGDALVVRVRTAAVGNTSFTFEYEIAGKDDGRVFANARTVQVMYDNRTGRPVPIEPRFRELLESARSATPQLAAPEP